MSTQSEISANLIALDFDNSSDEAVYNKIAESVGLVVDDTITEMGNNAALITSIISTQRYGKSDYYTTHAKAFQYGDNLVIDPVTFDDVYAVIDTTKQIISQAAFEEIVSGSNSELFLKIATIDPTTGDLVPLSSPQLSAFKAYFLNFQIPGLPVSILSLPGNVFNFNARATYFATYDLPTLQTNVAAAMATFRKSFGFNGELFVSDLSTYIRNNVPGMRDFYMFNTTIDGSPFNGSISLTAGYFNYFSAILSNITYIAT